MMLYKLKKSRSPKALDILKRNNQKMEHLLSIEEEEFT